MKRAAKRRTNSSARETKPTSSPSRAKRLSAWQKTSLIAGAIGAVFAAIIQIPAVKTTVYGLLFGPSIKLRITACQPKLITATFTNRGGRAGRVAPPSFWKIVGNSSTSIELDGVLEEPIPPEGIDIPPDGEDKHFSYKNEGVFFSTSDTEGPSQGKNPPGETCKVRATSNVMSGGDREQTLESKPRACSCK